MLMLHSEKFKIFKLDITKNVRDGSSHYKTNPNTKPKHIKWTWTTMLVEHLIIPV